MTDNKPQDATTIIAYKGMNKDFACTGGPSPFQYEIGKTYEHAGKIVRCASGGFHACESPFDVWNYYGPADSRFALVELSGKISRGDGDSKIAAGRLTVKAELKLPEIISAGVRFLIDACKTEPVGGEVSSGDSAQIGSSGYSAKIGSSGDSAKIGSSGDYAQIEATGKDAVVACAGSVYRFKLGDNGCVTVPYSDGQRTRFAVGYVGENMKAGTWYEVSDKGEFVEVAP